MCVIYLLSNHTKLKQNNGHLTIEKDGKRVTNVLLDEVECIVQGRKAEVTTSVLYALLERNIHIFYVDGRGRLLGQLGNFTLDWERGQCQYRCFNDAQKQLDCIRYVLNDKMAGQIALLRYYAKNKKDLEIAHLADTIKIYRSKLHDVSEINALRGLEGMASRNYFDAFPLILDTEKWQWNGRNRRPPMDPVNALLSYGYAFLEREVRLAILAARLDVRIGFLHSNNGRKDSLAYDLMEPFRQTIIDRLVLKSLNRDQFHPDEFTFDEDEGCRISDKARIRWIANYEESMQKPCREYKGLSPREWIRFRIRQFADELFRQTVPAL